MHCKCCYNKYAVGDDLFECSAGRGHLVCKSCIQKYVIDQVYGKNIARKLECFVANECNCKFSEDTLDRALPKDLKSRVDQAIHRQDIRGQEGFWWVAFCVLTSFGWISDEW